MRKFLASIILLLFVMPAFAGNKITTVVKAPKGVRVTKNMIFLFDCSTSMGRTNRLQTAMAEFRGIIGQPMDDGMFSLLTFQAREESIKIWPGFKEKDDPKPPPKGWAKLPSLNALKAANKWLNGIGCWNYTDMGTIIKKAFALNKNREKLTIILFTDGNNTYPNFNGQKPSAVAALIKKLNKQRIKAKKDMIRIFVFGVSAEQNVVMLSEIAKAGSGSYITSDKICPICRKFKKDVPEVQQVHRSEHIKPEEEDDEE